MVRLIRLSVRFVLLLLDDYSGANTAGGGHLFIVDGRAAHPVRKPEGCYVFTGPPGREAVVQILSASYCTRTVRVPPYSGQVCTVRLFRRPKTSFSDCDWADGVLRPGLLAVGLIGDSAPPRLREIGTSPPSLRLQGYYPQSLRGLCLCIGSGAGRELLMLGEKREDGSYVLAAPPRFEHHAGEALLRAGCAPCDAQGHYSIPVPPGTAPAQLTVLGYDEEAQRWEC